MRLTSIAVALALATTIAGPQAWAQSVGFPLPALVPLKAPENSAVRPGGRYGVFTTPRAVAVAWAQGVRNTFPDPARLAQGIGSYLFQTPEEQAAPKFFEASGRTGIFGTYADIGLQLNVRFEVKADQFRNLACTADEIQNPLAGCAAKFPTISPNPQYSILSSGVIGQRLHVNVDFNSQREFDASNTIQVWYEGLPDEVLRRVEAGNVSFSVPASRFISAAVPANNFGFQAVAQVGDLQLRGIYAQQKGTVVKDRIYTVGQATNQSVSRDGRDLDYEAGRFFFAVDPARIPGYPAVDILNLDQLALPADLRVSSLYVYRVRAVAPGSTSNQNIGGVKAVACGTSTARGGVQCSGPGVERAGPFQWQILVQGKDYYVDPTGAWFAMASALDQNDYLAVSYVPLSGTDTVGTLPTTANPDTTRIDTLRLVYDPTPSVTAASPAFRFEIRSVYRFGSGDLTRESAQFSITVNQRQRTVASGQTYLQLLGLALSSNPTQFDQYNRLFPRTRDPLGGAPLQDLYVVFPNLQPFADSTKLVAAERNDSLYRTPRGFLATQGPPSVFALHYQATAVASADRSTLSLNSFQIRDGSEKIFVGQTQLTRGTDYTIDYSTGTVSFLHPDSLFQNGVSQVHAQFEERTGFSVAPTSIYGLASEYSLGSTGRVDLTGIFQSQQSPFTRPPLGSEPSSSFIGGISTELRFQPTWLTDAVSSIPGIHGEAPSFINLNAELAVSKPQPNSTGQAYLEEFESQSGRFISMSDVNWQWGSIPTSTRGAEPYGFSSGTFDQVNAAFMTWQSLPVNCAYVKGVCTGQTPVQFLPQQIDPEILLTGATQTPEPVLWLTLKPDTVLGLAHTGGDTAMIGTPNWVRPPVFGPRWRSITQTLSATGIDLTRVEYLEFWVWEDGKRTARANKTAVLFDFGSTFEDALAFVPDSFTYDQQGDTTYYGQRAVGLGKLDTERDPLTHSWNAAINDNGILSDRVTDGIKDMVKGTITDSLFLCSAAVNGVVAQYAFGDIRSRCGRKNGAVDTEDQDGDFQLDSVVGVKTHEDFVRFVFPIGSDKYYVRDGGMTADPAGGTAGWRLYRIPFRTDTLTQGTPNLRQVQSLRITIVAPEVGPPGTPQPQVFFALSRVQLVGASWLKRADTPIPGIAGEQGALGGQVVASFVSTENRDLGYTPPPGVVNEAANQGAGLSLNTTQINEQSLRILATGLQKGQHAEAFNRFTTEGDKNLLRYRELRVWARGRGPGWDDGDLEFYIKVGKDENNFYMYHTPARTASWEPEVVAQFDPWLALRAAIEKAWLRGDPPQVYAPCDTSIVPNDSSYVMCNGPYIVHIHDPATAPPNLAAVEELATGILRVNNKTFIDQAELWVDDIRVSNVVTDLGMAGAVDLAVTASNLADLTFSLTRREANFAQLGEDPTYTTDNGLSLAGTFHLERFMPSAWGLAMPLSYQYQTTSSDPFYLEGTDIRADQLGPDLRTPRSINRALTFGVRRVKRSQAFLGRYFLDPVSLSFSYVEGDFRTDLSSASSSSFAYGLNYNLALNPVRIPFLPRFIDRLREHLLGGSGPAAFRINPTTISFSSSYAGAQATQFSFPVAIREPSDASITPTGYWSRLWQNQGALQFAPLSGITMRVDASSLRDLHDYGDSTSIGRLLLLQRRTLFGADIGIETQRRLNTFIGFTPKVAQWIRPRLTLSGSFSLSRDPNASAPVFTPDSSFRLPLAFSNSQRVDGGAQLDPGRFARTAFGDSSFAAKLLKHLVSIDFSVTRTRNSSFGQAPGGPTAAYQLGLGSLADFQKQAGVIASSAAQTTTDAANANADLILGFRLGTTYQRTSAVSYILRGTAPSQVTSHSQDWPNGTLSWTFSPPPGGLGLSKLLNGVTAQVNVRRHESSTSQPTIETGDNQQSSVSQGTERVTSPSLSLSWVHGILTSADYTSDRSEQVASGSLVRTTTSTTNAYVAFAFRPPPSIVKLPTDVRTTARYTVTTSLQCIQPVSVSECIPFVDTQQKQTQLSMDTEFPPTFSAGLQVAYIVNQQFQLNQKTAQLTITAYVSLSASVGQFR